MTLLSDLVADGNRKSARNLNEFCLTATFREDGRTYFSLCPRDGQRPLPGDPSRIDCAGVWTYGRFDRKGTVDSKDDVVICWGKVTAEDKTAPRLVCGPAPITLDCYDVDYVLNNKLTIGNVGATASPRPTASSDGRTFTNAEGVAKGSNVGDPCFDRLAPPNLVSDNIRNLGYAYYEDNCFDCGCKVTLKWTDKVVFYSCTDPEFTNPRKRYYAKIEREWVATDCNGMRQDAYIQEIYFTRPDLEDFEFAIGKPDDRDVTGEEGVELDEVGYNWTVELPVLYR
ncbi:MAG: hypothetical protein IPO07_23815 [Haliscomenobacter sp.]|nr:hypothetical protein [Haliscomenobacter sp.]MBK9491473.1 hypothetical protein [Haliscomenobacter sp.]